nr:MAG TPA: hypothetical protein [Caudoviricetes sp.]
MALRGDKISDAFYFRSYIYTHICSHLLYG